MAIQSKQGDGQSASAAKAFRPVPDAPAPPISTPSVARATSPGEKIFELSNSSDPKDRFAAYKLVDRCRDFKMLQKQADNTVQSQRVNDDSGIAQLRGACDGVTDQQLALRFENLKASLAANVPGAARASFYEGPNGDPLALEQRPDDLLVVEWKKHAVDLLKGAAESGDSSAIDTLIQIYAGDGTIAQPDRVQELAYTLVLARITANTDHPYPKAFIDRQEQSMTSEQIATATQQSSALFDRCCNSSNQLLIRYETQPSP